MIAGPRLLAMAVLLGRRLASVGSAATSAGSAAPPLARPRFHWPLARNASDVAGNPTANDMVCQTLPGYPCPSFNETGTMFPGQTAAAFFPQGDTLPSSRGYWKGGDGLRTVKPVHLTRDRAYTVWWRATFLPPAPPRYNIDQAQIFGATNNGTGQSWYLTFWNASRGTLPPEVCGKVAGTFPPCRLADQKSAAPSGPGSRLPVCGPLLSFVFAVQNANFIQYCTDPRTFKVDVGETHFVGFSSSGIDNSSFVSIIHMRGSWRIFTGAWTGLLLRRCGPFEGAGAVRRAGRPGEERPDGAGAATASWRRGRGRLRRWDGVRPIRRLHREHAVL